MRVCILTGGGDAPGLNAVLRGFVKRAHQLDIEVYGSEDGFEGLLHPTGGLVKMDPSSVRGILPRGGSILGCSNKSNPFAMRVRQKMALRGSSITSIPLGDVGDQPRLVEAAGQLVAAARAVDIELGRAP